MTNSELENVRQKIDALDEELILVLQKRTALVREIGKMKKASGLPLFDEKRWKEMLETRLSAARRLGVSPELVKNLYEEIHHYSLEIEKAL